jgi:hypothetical protein
MGAVREGKRGEVALAASDSCGVLSCLLPAGAHAGDLPLLQREEDNALQRVPR